MEPTTISKDSMKSTWRMGDRSKWTYNHWMIVGFGLYPQHLDRPIPVHNKDDKVPYYPQWRAHCWVILHAAWPLLLHQLYVHYTGQNFGYLAAIIYYAVAYNINAMAELHMIREMAHTYGFLDGDKHERDQVPDNSVTKVWHGLQKVAWTRPLVSILVAYRKGQTPSSITSWALIEVALYPIVLDFWFYLYHRAMHEVDWLWQYHRTHHLTKHPNPLLTIFADAEQEFFDAIGIPLLTYATMKLLGLPMNYYEWWMCHQYVVFTELIGHSGLRIYGHPPNLAAYFLKIFDAELVVEDHDLHHRQGYRKSMNYGKQTRLWDRLFGTVGERLESVESKVDYINVVKGPLF